MRIRVLITVTALLVGISVAGVSAQNVDSTGGREKRIEERKAKLKEKLSTAQETRLKDRCKLAQGRIEKIQKLAADHHDARDKRLDSLLDKLNEAISKLKAGNKNTASVETALAGVSAGRQNVKTAYEAYIAALSDTSSMDCQTDPEGFKASLVDARSRFQELKQARQELRQMLKDELLPALKQLRQKGTN